MIIINNKYEYGRNIDGIQYDRNYYNNYSNTNSIKNEYIPNEQSYVENILRLNKGKKVTVYQSFCDSNEWKDSTFTGIIEQSGRDHIILSDPTSGKWYLLLMIYVNYIKFDEEINTVEQFYPSNY